MSATSQPIQVTDPDLQSLAGALQNAKPDHPIPAELVEAIYSLGYQRLVSGGYAEAARCFEFISDYSPADDRIWCAWGESLQAQGEYEAALRAYAMAAALKPANPALLLAMGQCFSALGLPGHAAQSCELAIVMAGEAHPEIAVRAKGLLELAVR